MESAAKRKASTAVMGENEGRAGKRLKTSAESNSNAESVDSTTTAGLKFLESLKAAKDKTGRPIAGHFLTLPSKNELPDYYDFIKLPIAIDTIEDKLVNGEYTSLAQVESDCKRLVNNAKSYNDKKSLIYEDAERLRKTASNWMVKHNPAYRDGNYVAIATPVPGEENATPGKPIPRMVSTPKSAQTPASTSTTTERPRRSAAVAQATPAPSKLRQSSSAALAKAEEVEEEEEENKSTDFVGKTFQEAQEQIVQDIIDYEDGGLQIFLPFVNLPSRALKDYYQLIKDPMSLTSVQKKVKGVVGREQPTGHTLFKNWDSFETTMSVIWKNARIYNEDGSDIYNLSQELEEMFYEKLKDARANVDEPIQPKLKLNMSSGAAPKQQLKLKLRQSPASDRQTPGARSSATPSISVDNEALQRQQRHVLEGMNGNRASSGKPGTPSGLTNPFTGPRGTSSTAAPVPGAQMRTAGSPPTMNGIKQDVQSPALNAIRLAGTPQIPGSSIPTQTPMPAMAPPHAMARPASGSPHPNGVPHHTNYNAAVQPPNYYMQQHTPHMDSFRKVALKNIDDALIPKITLNTHPALNLAKPWSVDIRAHKQKTAHSATIVVAQTHSYLQVTPKVPIALTGRLYRLFVTVNGNRTLEVNRVPVTAGINGTNPGPGYEGGKKKGEPVFEAKLVGGVNRIEVEIVAEKDKKNSPGTESSAASTSSSSSASANAKDQVEIEKCTIFLHLMRQPSY